MKWLNQLFGGPKDMAALTAGTKAPDFSLAALDGGNFSLQEALQRGPVLAVFFKVSCPTCQYTFPFLERIHQAYGDRKISVVGISQNNKSETGAFLKEYGITFKTLLDDPNGYAVSNAFGITNVPSLFLIEQNGTIGVSSVGWLKRDVEDIYRKVGAGEQAPLPPIFRPGDDVRDFRAG